MKNQLLGTQIVRANPYYENIYVSTGNNEGFFLSIEELTKILSEFDFNIEKKKTRKWLSVDLNEWRVEKFNEPRS